MGFTFQLAGFLHVVLLATVGCQFFPGSSSGTRSLDELAKRGVNLPADVVGAVALTENPNAASGLPKALIKRPEVIVSRAEYVLSWNPVTRGPNWSAWRLAQDDIGRGRTGDFMEDPVLQDYLQPFGLAGVRWADYKQSCFDRGHMVPSGDRNSSPEHNQATFYTDNLWPQTGFLNRVAWNHLEMRERQLVTDQPGTTLQIFAGPLFEEDFGKIGSSKDVTVPSHFWKVVLRTSSGAAKGEPLEQFPIAVIMPNRLSNGKKPSEDFTQHCVEFEDKGLGNRDTDMNDWTKYKTTVEEIEKRSGLDIPEIK